MPLDKRQRDAMFLELSITTNRKDGPDVSADQIVQKLIEMLADVNEDTALETHPLCSFYTESGRIIEGDEIQAAAAQKRARVIFLQKVDMVPNCGAVLLFRYATMTGADAAYFHLRTKTVRHVTKEDGEANAYSAHLLINWEKLAGNGGPRVILEKVPGLSQTAIFGLLNRKLKERAENDPEFTHPSRKKPGTSEPFRPILQPAYVPSQDLAAALEAGTAILERVVFARRPETDDGEEDEGVFDKLGEEVTFGIVAGDGSVKDALARKWAAMRGKGYNSMRIKYRAPGLSRSMTHKVLKEEVEGEEPEAAEVGAGAEPGEDGVDVAAERADEMGLGLLMRIEECEFDSDLAQCHLDVVNDIVARFKALTLEDDKWR